MLNLGSLFEKPYESGYGSFHRFLNANRGIVITCERLNDELAQKFGKLKPSVPHGEIKRAYKSGCLQRNSLTITNKSESLSKYYLPTKYRPESHCPHCAKIKYHSYIFDFPWLKECPIHHVHLESKCPDCDERWPSVSELGRSKCKTCDPAVTFEEWVENDSIPPDVFEKALEPYLELQALLESDRFPRTILQGIGLHGESLSLYLNTWDEYKLAVLEKRNLLPDGLDQSTLTTGHYTPLLDSVSFNYRKLLSGKSVMKNWRDTATPNFTKLRVQTKRAFESLHCGSHKLGDCSGQDKICILCGAWAAWKQAYSSDYNLAWIPSLKNWCHDYVQIRAFRMQALTPPLIGKIAIVGNLDIEFSPEIVERLNLASSLQFLISLLVMLFYQAEYKRKNPEHNIEAHREMLFHLQKRPELGKVNFFLILDNEEIQISWNKAVLPVDICESKIR